jgi:SAM-dependent methyltransferase
MNNTVRGPINAAILRGADRYGHHVFGLRKEALFADLPSTVVEIGPGTGANLRYYRPGTHLIGIEPNRSMHAPLQRAARSHGIELDLRAESAERIGLDDASVDAVISTLVLCSVPDPVAVVAELKRILRPGGRFVFLEHVRAGADHRLLRAVQHTVARPWRWLFEGCDVVRDTERTLAGAGFATLEVERYRVGSLFVPINAQIAGTATR